MPLLTAADLQKLCHDAFRQYPHSCSHAVWHVMNGALRPPLAPYHFRQANQLIDFLTMHRSGQQSLCKKPVSTQMQER